MKLNCETWTDFNNEGKISIILLKIKYGFSEIFAAFAQDRLLTA